MNWMCSTRSFYYHEIDPLILIGKNECIISRRIILSIILLVQDRV